MKLTMLLTSALLLARAAAGESSDAVPTPPPPVTPAAGQKSGADAAPGAAPAAGEAEGQVPGLLAEVIAKTREELERIPTRQPGAPAGTDEYVLRLQLAAAAIAADKPGEAYLALRSLPAKVPADRFEVERLALLAAASWRSGEEKQSEELAAALLAAVSAGRRLALRSLVLVDKVYGYGNYVERTVKAVRPGEEVQAYVEVLDFRCAESGAGEYLAALDIGLAYEQEVEQVDRRGVKVMERQVLHSFPEYSQVRHRTRSPLRDLHLWVRLRIPRELAPGRDYTLRLTVTDRNTGGGGVSGGDASGPAAECASASHLLVIRVAG